MTRLNVMFKGEMCYFIVVSGIFYSRPPFQLCIKRFDTVTGVNSTQLPTMFLLLWTSRYVASVRKFMCYLPPNFCLGHVSMGSGWCSGWGSQRKVTGFRLQCLQPNSYLVLNDMSEFTEAKLLVCVCVCVCMYAHTQYLFSSSRLLLS